MHETVLCDETSWSSLLEIPFALGIHYYAGKFFDNKKVKLQIIEPLIQNGRRRVKNFCMLQNDAPIFLKLFSAYSKFIWSATEDIVSKHIDTATSTPRCFVMLRCNNSLL